MERATLDDVENFLTLEQKVSDQRTYSAMAERTDAEKEIETNVVYLIKKDEAVVGSIAYQIKSEVHAYLSGLVIDPEYQGIGLGREALKRVLEELEPMERIDLVTHPENTPALELYLSLGFEVESKKENYYGDGEPRLVLVKTRDSGKPVV
ncbi:MAG: N-acetyltransferase [Candidatus Moraniibacteriota bacterium]